MNLYLISQSVNNDYDTYDSAVVCAATREAARLISPGSIESWASPDNVDVDFIGTADIGIPENSIVCSSFNGG